MRFVFFLSLVLATVGTDFHASCRAVEVAEIALVGELQQYMDAVVDAKGFSGSVRVVNDGEAVLNRGYGFADREHQVPNTPSTKFRIGSITKQFTSMCIMILHERKALDVSDTIGQYIDDAPDAWDKVTIHHLLTHTSGILSFTGMPDYRDRMMIPQSTKEMIDRIRDAQLEFDPGEDYRYSNSGYFLLGVIIESVSGKTYEQFLSSEVLDPLAMIDTGYDRSHVVLPNRARGYVRRRVGWANAEYLNMSQPFSAGALYSTVEDLSRWDTALRDGKLLSPEGFKTLWTPEKNGYAYGWMVGKKDGLQVQHHGGGINGFASHFIRIPERKMSVSVLCNKLPANPAKLANDLVRIIQGKQVDFPGKPVPSGS